MAKMILSMDGLVLKEIALNKERMTIGRKPHNDIQIDNLAVSGEHAALVCILDDAFIEDLDSTNGTLVNGQPVRKHLLRDGDVVELGKYKLKYIAEKVMPTVDAADFEKTMILRPGALPAAASAASGEGGAAVAVRPPSPAEAPPVSAPRPAPVRQPAAAIQVLNGANAGRELELTKSLTTFGKPGVQVAVIARRPHGYFITHVEGERFPVLNGRTLDAQAHPLADHDVIEIAGVKMEFFLKA